MEWGLLLFFWMSKECLFCMVGLKEYFGREDLNKIVKMVIGFCDLVKAV